MSLYNETFVGGIFDNAFKDTDGLKLSYSAFNEKCNDSYARAGGSSYKNIVQFLEDGLNLTYVKFHAYQAGTYSLSINSGTSIDVVSIGNGWIIFNLPTPINLTKGINYTFTITPPANDSIVYAYGSYFNGMYWLSSTSYIGATIYYETIAMEFGFVNSIGSYISTPYSLVNEQSGLSANWQSSIPTSSILDVQIGVTNSSADVPLKWSSIDNGHAIQDILFTMDLTDKFLWFKYNLTSQNTTDILIVNSLQLDNYTSTGLEIYTNKTEENWIGVLPVIGLTDDSIIPNARIKVISGYGETFYFPLSWDEVRKRFFGLVKIDSLWVNQLKPSINNLTVSLETSEATDFLVISKVSPVSSISLYQVYRRTSYDGITTNTQFNPTWDGSKWIYSIRKFAIFTPTGLGQKNNAVIPIKFHPITSVITIKNVIYDPINENPSTIPNTDPYGKETGWWWDNTEHTLYIKLEYVTEMIVDANGSYSSIINIDFESDTDLFATRFEMVQTTNFGTRTFYNGLVLANNYYSTVIMGTDGLGAGGKQVDTHVRKKGQDEPIVIDCMERVAVHVDDVILYTNKINVLYPANILWKENWQDFIFSEDNNEIIIRTVSDPNMWEQQKATGISAERIVSIRSNSRIGKQDYKLTNNGGTARKFPFVWGKEPWAGYDKQLNDRGIYSGDLVTTNQVDCVKDITTLPNKWMLHYDSQKFVGMGIMFPEVTSGKAYFVRNAPIYRNAPGANYPIPVNIQTGADVDSMFMETVFDNVQPNESVYISFYQGQYSGDEFNDLYLEIEDDYSTLIPSPITVTGQTLRTIMGGLNGLINFDLEELIYLINTQDFDSKQSLYKNLNLLLDSYQKIYNSISNNFDTRLSIYKSNSILFDSLQKIFQDGITGSSLFDFKMLLYKNNIKNIDMVQKIYKNSQASYFTKQSIFKSNEINYDTLQEFINILESKQYEDIYLVISRSTDLNAKITKSVDFNLNL